MKLINKERWVYYGEGFVVLLPCSIVFWITGVTLINMMFFLTAFIWNFAINTPGVRERIRDSRRYRFSFLRAIVKLEQFLSLRIQTISRASYVRPLVRATIPLVFFIFLMAFFKVGNALFALLGVVNFELFFWLNEKNIDLKFYRKLSFIFRKRFRSK